MISNGRFQSGNPFTWSQRIPSYGMLGGGKGSQVFAIFSYIL